MALCIPPSLFTWDPAEQQSFDSFKAAPALTLAQVLCVWDPVRLTCLLTDALELGCSILEQPYDAGEFHPVAFKLCKLTQLEHSNSPHLLALLAAPVMFFYKYHISIFVVLFYSLQTESSSSSLHKPVCSLLRWLCSLSHVAALQLTQ